MTQTSKEGRLYEAFSSIAETLTSDYDVVQLLHTVMGECLELLDVQAGGLLLKNADGQLELVASTSEGASFVEVMQLNAGAGPCVECLQTGHPVSVLDVEQVNADWSQFQDAALQQGYHSAHAVPLRVRSETIGSIGLFRAGTGDLDRTDADVARTLASLASVGIMQERIVRDSTLVAEQLQRALDSRVVIEQAKGVLAATTDVDMDDAFRMLRSHARSSNRKLHDVAQAVVARTLRIDRDPQLRGGRH